MAGRGQGHGDGPAGRPSKVENAVQGRLCARARACTYVCVCTCVRAGDLGDHSSSWLSPGAFARVAPCAMRTASAYPAACTHHQAGRPQRIPVTHAGAHAHTRTRSHAHTQGFLLGRAPSGYTDTSLRGREGGCGERCSPSADGGGASVEVPGVGGSRAKGGGGGVAGIARVPVPAVAAVAAAAAAAADDAVDVGEGRLRGEGGGAEGASTCGCGGGGGEGTRTAPHQAPAVGNVRNGEECTDCTEAGKAKHAPPAVGNAWDCKEDARTHNGSGRTTLWGAAQDPAAHVSQGAHAIGWSPGVTTVAATGGAADWEGDTHGPEKGMSWGIQLGADA